LTSDQNNQGINQEENEVKATQYATFLVHCKEHGLTYAVVLLLAQQMGLLDQLLTSLGGMC
jgi:23S rRNA G2069 N7-methylase RlmK/C1962 C5-methylase RlmI